MDKSASRQNKAIKAIHCETLNSVYVSARDLAKVAGQCISMTKAIVPGKLLLHNIYRIIASCTDWEDKHLLLSDGAVKDLKWWLNALKGWNGAPLRSVPVDLQVETDASSSGWRAWIHVEKSESGKPEKFDISAGLQAAGLWNKQVSFKHSNFRELLAVLKALKSFQTVIEGKKHVQILSHNIVTVAYINHLGGPCMDLSDLMTSIWSVADHLGVILSARHLSGSSISGLIP